MMYPIAKIFHSLQGEGHFVGYPMTFVRFAGCSVAGCAIRVECDEAPWKATERLDTRGVIARVKGFQAASEGGIVCLTGGEPTDHDLTSVVAALRDEGFRVHIETSGVRSLSGTPLDWITVSPKTAGYVQRAGHTLKVIVRPEWGADAWTRIELINRGTEFFHRYLQPMTNLDGTSNLSQVVAMLTANVRPGWALSTQAHKTWSVK